MPSDSDINRMLGDHGESSVDAGSASSPAMGSAHDIALSVTALDHLDNPALLMRLDGLIIDANPPALDCYRHSRAEMLSLSIRDIEEPRNDGEGDRRLQEAAVSGALFESVHRRSDGTLFPVEIRLVPVRSDGRAALLGLVRDISECRQTEEALRASEQRFRAIGESISDVVWILDPQTLRFLYISPSVLKLSGFTSEEGMAGTMDAIMTPDSAQFMRDVLRQRMGDFLSSKELPAGSHTHEVEHPRKDGSTVWTEITAAWRLDEETGRPEVYGVSRDITDRKQAEAYGAMGREILQILNEPADLVDSMRRAIATLKTRTGLDAVGIRLQDGDDFPYIAEENFAADFLMTENTLIERASDGRASRDGDGRVSFECTCGLVISGKTDAGNPLYTAAGSFWTNDSFPLLDLQPDQDPRNRPRNRCIHGGYASIALVPIRSMDRIVGLIHLNDRRPGRFTSDMIERLEGIAAHIGAALMRKQAEERLLRYQARLREFAAELVASREQEQRRLGGELHEGVGQVLAAAKMAAQLLAAEPLESPAREQAEGLVDLLGESIDQVRQLTSALTPSVLFELGLGPALLWLRDRHRRVHGLQCTVRIDEEAMRLRNETAMFLFRVVREALENVVCHSGVLQATAVVRMSDGWITVSITDRGGGFDPTQREDSGEETGFGLFSIREECRRMGGTMEVSSKPGWGTRITVRIPDATHSAT